MSLPGYYTPAEAAAVLGVSRSMITRYAQAHDPAKRLPAKRVGRQLFFEQADVHRFSRTPVGNPNFRSQTA